jgi:uncharacterized protein YcbX
VDAIVSALFVYPVKSCRGIAVEHAAVERRGLAHDRRWMIVDASGQFITQRTEPRLACVAVSIEGDELVLRAPHASPLRVPVAPAPSAERRRVRVWRDEVDAIDCGAVASAWLSAWLGASVALVFMPDDVERRVNPSYAREGDLVSFADGFPLLVASASSLDDLDARLDAPVPMDRFRPNVVVRGCAPWAEDTWKLVRLGAVPVRVLKPCDRCVVTTTDQLTGERGVEPLRTLATFRARDNKVYFAQNAVPEAPGTIAVGDPVTVLECLESPK